MQTQTPTHTELKYNEKAMIKMEALGCLRDMSDFYSLLEVTLKDTFPGNKMSLSIKSIGHQRK